MTSLFSKSQWTYEKENQVHAVLPCFQVRGIFSRFVNVPSWSDRGFKKLYILTLLSRPGTVIDRFLLVSGTDLFFSLFFIYFAPSFVLDVHRLSTLTNNNGRSWRGAAAVSSLSLFFFLLFLAVAVSFCAASKEERVVVVVGRLRGCSFYDISPSSAVLSPL